MTNGIDKATADAAFAFTKEWEGFSPTGAPDRIGIPTLGYGYALIVKDGKDWKLKKNLATDLRSVGITLTENQKQQLAAIETELDNGNFAGARQLAKGFAVPQITPAQGEALYRRNLPKHVGFVRGTIGKAEYDGLDPERRAALIDTAFLAPARFKKVAKAIGNAIKLGDVEAAAKELAKVSDGTKANVRPANNAEFFRNPHAASRLRVQGGATLSEIAREAGRRIGRDVSVGELQRLNGIKNPGQIRVGQFLKLPEPAGSDVGAPGSIGATPTGTVPKTAPPPAKPKPRTDLDGDGPAIADVAKSALIRATSPEVRRLTSFVNQPPSPEESILLRRPDQVTGDEIAALSGLPGYWDSRHPLHERLQDFTRRWHLRHFGDGPVRRDDAGRIPPTRPLPMRPGTPSTPDGVSLGSATAVVGAEIGRMAEKAGLAPATERVQMALNDLPDLAAAGPARRLRVDGDFGPETRFRLREAVARNGAAPVLDAIQRARRAGAA